MITDVFFSAFLDFLGTSIALLITNLGIIYFFVRGMR